MSNLYKTIMELCEQKGISGYRLCKDAKIQPSILTDLKMGRQKSLSARNADKIANYFGVSVGFLLGTTKGFPPLVHDEILLNPGSVQVDENEKKPTDQKADGLRGMGYEKLTPENQKVIDALIETLLNSQSLG